MGADRTCFAHFYYNCMTYKQGSEPAGGQVLEVVETVSDLISQTLVTDGNKSLNFSKQGSTISKQ